MAIAYFQRDERYGDGRWLRSDTPDGGYWLQADRDARDDELDRLAVNRRNLTTLGWSLGTRGPGNAYDAIREGVIACVTCGGAGCPDCRDTGRTLP